MRQTQRPKYAYALLILAVFIVITLSSFVSAKADDKYAPSIFQGWDAAKGNMLSNFWNGINFFGDNHLPPEADADKYGWYNGTFFGLANWEKDICMTDLSSDVRQVTDTVSDQNGETHVYTTTITLSAKKTPSFNSSLYEVSWYAMPYGTSGAGFKIRVYLTDGRGNKEFFAGKNTTGTDAFTDAATGSRDYQVRYLTADFTKVVLEYKFGDTDDVQTFSSSVVSPGDGDANNPMGGQGQNPTNPTSSQNPPTDGLNGCPAPIPPKVDQINVHTHNRGWDATPIVIRNCDYCASIGMGTMGGQPRCSCPARPDGHPDRPACEKQMMGGMPRWFCDGAEIQSTDNPYQANCGNNVKVCNADLSVCGTPNG